MPNVNMSSANNPQAQAIAKQNAQNIALNNTPSTAVVNQARADAQRVAALVKAGDPSVT